MPVGFPVAGDVAATVAVYVIDCPMLAVRSLELTVVEVAPRLTVWVKLSDVDVAKLASPEMIAVIVSAGSGERRNARRCARRDCLRGAAGDRDATLEELDGPGRTSGPGAVTEIVAVSVTLCPTTEGLTLEVTAVVVEALPTLSLSAVEVEVAKLASPPKTAVIE